jgi:hypothetical protein
MYYTKVCKLSTPFCATDISLNHSTTMLVLNFFSLFTKKKKYIILNRKNYEINSILGREKKTGIMQQVNFLAAQIYETDFYGCFFTCLHMRM